jgi:hypothetical protein
MEAKSQLFLKYFTLFMNLLNDCGEAGGAVMSGGRKSSVKYLYLCDIGIELVFVEFYSSFYMGLYCTLENTPVPGGRKNISRCHLGGKNMKRGRKKENVKEKKERGKIKEERGKKKRKF